MKNIAIIIGICVLVQSPLFAQEKPLLPEVTEKEIQDFYESNMAQFRTSEGEPMPLSKIHDYIKQFVAHQKLTDNSWQEARKKVTVTLTCRNSGNALTIGEPLLLRLVLTNISDTTVQYDPTGVGRFNSIRIIDASGKEVPYQGGYPQHMKSPAGTLGAHETVVLFDDLDVTKEYFLSTPGEYTIQFRGQNWSAWQEGIVMPPSNTISVVVKPGNPRLETKLVEKLSSIIPQKWTIEHVSKRSLECPDGSLVVVTEAMMEKIIAGRGKGNAPQIHLSLLDKPREELNVQCAASYSYFLNGTYLGKSDFGHIYCSSYEAWPNAEAQIQQVLGTSP